MIENTQRSIIKIFFIVSNWLVFSQFTETNKWNPMICKIKFYFCHWTHSLSQPQYPYYELFFCLLSLRFFFSFPFFFLNQGDIISIRCNTQILSTLLHELWQIYTPVYTAMSTYGNSPQSSFVSFPSQSPHLVLGSYCSDFYHLWLVLSLRISNNWRHTVRTLVSGLFCSA